MIMKCKNCGADVKDGAKFCSECGAKIENAETPPKPKDDSKNVEKDNTRVNNSDNKKEESKKENSGFKKFFSDKKNIVISALIAIILVFGIFYVVNQSGSGFGNNSYDGTYYEDTSYEPIKVTVKDGKLSVLGGSNSISEEYTYNKDSDSISMQYETTDDDGSKWTHTYTLSTSADGYVLWHTWDNDSADEHKADSINLIKEDENSSDSIDTTSDSENASNQDNSDNKGKSSNVITGGSLVAGIYTVGSDLQPGIYDFTYTTSIPEEDYWGNDYLWITRSGSEGKSETLGGDKFDERYGDFDYSMASTGAAKCHVTLKEGDTVRVDADEGQWTY